MWPYCLKFSQKRYIFTQPMRVEECLPSPLAPFWWSFTSLFIMVGRATSPTHKWSLCRKLLTLIYTIGVMYTEEIRSQLTGFLKAVSPHKKTARHLANKRKEQMICCQSSWMTDSLPWPIRISCTIKHLAMAEGFFYTAFKKADCLVG